jgi:hypothetical protein
VCSFFVCQCWVSCFLWEQRLTHLVSVSYGPSCIYCLSMLLVPLGYVWKLLIPEADTSTMRGSIFMDTFSCLGTDTRPSAVNLRFWSLCSGKTASPWDRLFLLLSGNYGYFYSCSGTKPAINLVSDTITGPLYVNMLCVFLTVEIFQGSAQLYSLTYH